MEIWGAGMSGCLAALLFPSATIVEKCESAEKLAFHQALFRCRTPEIGLLTGLPFQKVQVHKGIWWDGPRSVSPRLANLYSQKVVGSIDSRSIWDLRTAERWIPPANFHKHMVSKIADRVKWGTEACGPSKDELIISTLPLSITAKIVGQTIPCLISQPIRVKRLSVPACTTYQTIYYPDPDDGTYRATLQGDVLIIEATPQPTDLSQVFESFGLSAETKKQNAEWITQPVGKIVENPDTKNCLAQLTSKHGIFSLGRFAVWRNILLEDVWHDIQIIQNMMMSQYNLQRRQI